MTLVVEPEIQRVEHPWYNYDKLFSYNALINIVAGGRGIGKTYGAVKIAIKHAIERGEEFVYLRRYRTETMRAKSTFFAAVGNEFPDWDFRVQGDKAQMSHRADADEDPRPWTTIGYFVSLSNAQTTKSVNFSDVTKIIFDEFISEKTGSGRDYLSDEATLFTNFFSTVDRYQDKTTAILLANAVTIMNPYFIDWRIFPDQVSTDGWMRARGGTIVAHFPDNEAFKSSIYETRFGKFIKDTEYAKYAVENEFSDNNDALIEEKTKDAYCLMALETRWGNFSIWHDMYKGEFHARKRIPKNARWFTTIIENVERGKGFIPYQDKRMQFIRTAFRQGMMTFDTPETRNAFTDVFKR